MSDKTITIDMPDAGSIGTEITAIGSAPEPIRNAEDRIALSERVGHCKRVLKQITCLFADSKKAASDAHKAICAAEKRLTDPINDFIGRANSRLWDYDAEQERKRREEEARLRREAEEKAEAERKRLASIAARCKDAEKKEAYQQAADAVQVSIPTLATAQDKAKGEVRQTRWVAELSDINAVIKAAAAGDVNACSCLAFDQSNADSMARMFRRDGVVTGVRFVEKTTIQHRG